MENFEGTSYRLANYWFQFIPRENRPINYLEIGTFYGANLFSVADTYAKHPDSKLYAIDPWIDYQDYPEYKDKQQDIYSTFLRNLDRSPHKSKINVIRGFSNEQIPKLNDDFFDIIYIDGNHEPEYILEDAVLAFRKLKRGGYLIFDDYNWVDENEPDKENHNTRNGIDGFVCAYRNKIDTQGLVIANSQVFIRKL